MCDGYRCSEPWPEKYWSMEDYYLKGADQPKICPHCQTTCYEPLPDFCAIKGRIRMRGYFTISTEEGTPE